MTNTLHSLGLDRLTRSERLAIVQELWDSIAPESVPTISDARRRELERRTDEDDEFPDDAIPWEEVRDQTRERFES